jgi:hypothetical protein
MDRRLEVGVIFVFNPCSPGALPQTPQGAPAICTGFRPEVCMKCKPRAVPEGSGDAIPWQGVKGEGFPL